MAQTKAERAATKRAWHAANSARIKPAKQAYDREYHQKNAARKRAAARAWALANPERARARSDAWRASNWDRLKGQYALYQAKRRALLAGTDSPGVTAEEWAAVVEFFDGRCAYCGKPGATIDHIIPISRGGRDALDNVQPACRRCNCSKGARLLSEWPLPDYHGPNSLKHEESPAVR